MAVRIDDLIQIIKERRSIERLKPDPVPFELVEKIIEAGTWAPSGNNAQPWEFIVLKSPEKIKGLMDLIAGPPPPDAPPRPPSYPPVHIVVVGDTRLKESYPENVDRDEVFHSSMAACIQNMQLATTALGLASSWGTMRHQAVPKVKSFLGIPEFYEIIAMYRLGYAVEPRQPRPRRPVSDVVHIDGADPSKIRSEEDLKQFIEDSGKGWGRL